MFKEGCSQEICNAYVWLKSCKVFYEYDDDDDDDEDGDDDDGDDDRCYHYRSGFNWVFSNQN